MFYKTSNPVLCFHRWTRKGYAIFASLHKVVKIGVVTFACTLVQLSYEPLLADVQDSTSRAGVNLDGGPACGMVRKCAARPSDGTPRNQRVTGQEP